MEKSTAIGELADSFNKNKIIDLFATPAVTRGIGFQVSSEEPRNFHF